MQAERGDNKFTGKIVKVTINTKPSGLSAADQKAVENAEGGGGAIVD
jgi:arylsulfatase